MNPVDQQLAYQQMIGQRIDSGNQYALGIARLMQEGKVATTQLMQNQQRLAMQERELQMEEGLFNSRRNLMSAQYDAQKLAIRSNTDLAPLHKQMLEAQVEVEKNKAQLMLHTAAGMPELTQAANLDLTDQIANLVAGKPPGPNTRFNALLGPTGKYRNLAGTEPVMKLMAETGDQLQKAIGVYSTPQRVNYQTGAGMISAGWEAVKAGNFEGGLSLVEEGKRWQENAAPKSTATAPSPELKRVQDYMSLRDAGKTEEAELMLGLLNKEGITVESTPGGGFSVSIGGKSKVPQAVTTQAIEKTAELASTVDLIDKVAPMLNKATAGVGGAVGGIIDASPLADIYPGVFSKERVQTKQFLQTLGSQVLKSVKSDAQIAEAERSQLMRIAPEVSAFKSVQQTREQLRNIRNLLGTGKRAWLEQMKQPIPPLLWTKDEVLNETKRKVAAGADKESAWRWARETMLKSVYPNEYNQQVYGGVTINP